MMCRSYPLKWWNSDCIPMGMFSPSTLSLLLDIMPLPERELDVFWLFFRWTLSSCKALDISPTGDHQRELLDRYDLLSRVRFLRMKSEEFELVKEREILTEEEATQIEKCIRFLESHRNVSSIIKCPSLPEGFSALSTPRNARLTNEQTFMRATLSNKTKWVYWGEVRCSFVSHYSLLVTGFTMYTRLPFAVDYNQRSSHYEEKLKVTVKDHNDRTLCSTNYCNPLVQYNSSLNIKLSEPFWVEPRECYSLHVEIERGQYPSYELANVVRKDQDIIEFQEKQNTCSPDDEPETCGLVAALLCKKYMPDQELLTTSDY